MGRRKWIGTIAVATTCALVGAAGGIATSGAASSAKTSSTTAKSASSAASHPDFGPGGPAVHSESVQLNKAGTAFITVTRDSGTVTAVSGSDITLHEGTSTVAYKDVTVTVPSGATVTRNDAAAALTDIKVGDRVSITQSSDGTQVRADDPTFKPTWPDGDHGHGGHGGPGGPGSPPRLAVTG